LAPVSDISAGSSISSGSRSSPQPWAYQLALLHAGKAMLYSETKQKPMLERKKERKKKRWRGNCFQV